ncbi:porin [Undibacterium sp. Ren11W]|uniref:porin n=1 Tax=Undibacterium sp. Ren11W TaxID=3413045 RepID=UPI003BF29867
MKKSLICAAALSMIASLAHAQSNVTIYGLIDANLTYNNNANAAKDGQFKLNSGGMNTSRLGFRGTEDLGNGLKAVMQLESGILLDTGASDGDMFGRQANVGLQGEFGKLIAGRSYSTTYDFILPFDPMGYAPQYSWATSAGATGSRKDGMLTGTSNMLKYQFDSTSFKLGATYGLGEVAGDSSSSAKLALAAAFMAGPFAATLAFDQVNGVATATGAMDKAKTIHAAANYQLDSVKLYAAYRNYKKTLASGAADLRSDLFWGGVDFKLSPVWTLTGAYYYQDIKNLAAAADADPSMFVARAKYALSKRTDIYVAGAYAKGRNDKIVGVSRDDAAFGTSQNSFTVGMQHRF